MSLAGPRGTPFVPARLLGLTGCPDCGLVNRLADGTCRRCGAALADHATRTGTQAVWAFWLTGIVCYVPANLLPMLITHTFGRTTENTIVGGAFGLAQQGEYVVSGIVFLASVAIPITKFVCIAWLALSIERGSFRGLQAKRRVHAVIEIIGRWSFIDVFVVAVLGALVQLGFLAEIDPGPAAGPFALSVIFTMLAAQRLDVRAVWNPDLREDA